MKYNKLDCHFTLEDFDKLSKLEKEHQKNLNFIDERISFFAQKLADFFKDKSVKQVLHIKEQPNISYYITHDDRCFVVELTSEFPSSDKLIIKEQPISCLPFSLLA